MTVFSKSWSNCREIKGLAYFPLLVRKRTGRKIIISPRPEGTKRMNHYKSLEGDSHVLRVTDKGCDLGSRDVA